MENQTINYVMDGKNIGIGIYSFVEGRQLYSKLGTILLFKNVSQARIFAENAKGYTSQFDYDLNIVINDSIIDFSYFDYVDGAYQLYAADGKIYNVKPVERFAVSKVGYLVFNNNQRLFGNNELGKQTCATNFEDFKNAANKIVRFPNRENAIESLKRTYNNIAIKVKKTSGVINVMYNSQIMNINQNRKSCGYRMLQFDKNMDKFNTLYFFIQREFYDPEFFGSTEKCVSVLNDIVAELRKVRPDVKIEYLDMVIPIEITADIITKYSILWEENRDDKINKS